MTPLLLLALAAPPAQDAAAGTRLFNAGDRAGAAVQFRAALAGNAPPPVYHAARHGLALCLIAADPPDWKQALPLLHPPAEDGSYPDRGDALELLGVGYRARAAAEGVGRRWDAHRWFLEAARWFADKKRPADAARCRCAAAELDLLLDNPQAAKAGTSGFLNDRDSARTPSGGRGLHLHALACLRLDDPAAAERAAGRVSAGDPAFADAQVVLGRVRLRAGDLSEAAALFAAAGDRPDAKFQSATLAFEAGRFADALATFQKLPGDDAAVWAGATLVRLGRFAEAVTVLEPLKPTAVHLPDQAARWLGEARLGLEQFDAAVVSLRSAADLVGKVPEHLDPAVRDRRHDTRFALADALMRAGKAAEAAELFRRVWDEGGRPKRRDELLARLVIAFRLADKPDHADTRAVEFRRLFPTSPLLPSVVLWQAENVAERRDRLFEREARLDLAVELFQEAESLAGNDLAERTRVGRAVALRALGRPAAAAAVLSGMAAAAAVRADCLLRADDPAEATRALDGVVPDQPATWLLSGHIRLRCGNPAAARDDFDELARRYPDHPLTARGRVDRELAAALAGDQQAVERLQRQADDPALQPDGLAGLAAVHAASLRPADAVESLTAAAGPLATAAKPGQLFVLYHRAAALSAAGRTAEAEQAFDELVRHESSMLVVHSAIGTAANRRAGECRLTLAAAALSSGPSESACRQVREAADGLVQRVDRMTAAVRRQAVKPYLFLLAARAHRRLAAVELARAWDNEKRHQRHRWADRGGDGPPPTVERNEVLVQWAERRAVEVYKRLADEMPGTPQAAVARLEAAAMLTERRDHKAAASLLADAGDTGLPPTLAARLRVALGDALVARDDLPAAVAAVEGLADPVATDRLAMWRLALGEPAKAIEACGSAPSRRLGETLAAAGRLDQAAGVFAKLDGPAARYGAGWVAARRGRLDEAVEQLRSVGDGKARLLLGLVLGTQGRRDEAVATLLAIRTGDDVEWAARMEACRISGDSDGLRRLFLDLPAESEWAIAAADRLP